MGRIARFLKVGKYAKRVNARAPVYLSVMLEYLAAEVSLLFFILFFLGSISWGCLVAENMWETGCD